MLSGLSHYWSNNPGSRMAKSGYKSGKINQIGIADVIVRNDEVVGSIPTSSTNNSIPYSLIAPPGFLQ